MKIHQDILDSCIAVAQQAGAFQMQYFRSMPESSQGSGGMGDMKTVRETVSFVDVESEKMLSAGLLPLVEGAGFYGEESGKSGSQELVWIVDPLDGTTNFLSGLDQFCVSIALVKEGQPQLGVIYKPSTGEVYSGLKGQGAFYNGVRTKPAYPEVTESDALFMTGFPYRSPDVSDQFFDAAAKVLMLGRGIRRSGSAALDVANLSMGWLQGFWETDLQPYDIAAGLLLMEENGVVVTNQHGDAYNMFEDRLMVAALPKVHPALMKTIASSYGI
jgi:myo-inositol-1(or 4)-monophosphatase